MAKKSTKKTAKKATRRKPNRFHSAVLVHGSKSKTGSLQRTAQATSSGTTLSAQSLAESPLYYDYRRSTPDKYYFPRDRATANSIWRDVYRRDATVAIATDMYAELPWSDFDIEGIDDSGIRKVYEDMFSDLNLVPKFPHFTKDFMVTGELILHNMFNSTKGYWERTISHNPDYVRVQGLGLAVDQPLLWMKPTPEIKALISSPDPRVRKFLSVIPKEIVNSFRMNKEIPLDPLNTTYMPRLNTSNDVRGTSIYTRLFRINMYEDFVINSSLAVSQRNAAPIRMFKLGDPTGNWMPTPTDIENFAELLSLAETDPLAAIITHPHVTVEYVGVSDRAMLISREWDFIERVKLLALGVAKSFLVGEVSFAAAIAGLQVLLERLASLRHKFEKDWMIAKLCKPIAEMHGFYERSQSELEHRIRIKPVEERKLVVPKIKWFKSLEPTQDASVLSVWRDLKERGILSDRTYASGSGLDIEVERRNLKEEAEYKEKQAEETGVPVEGLEAEEGAEPGRPPMPELPPASLHRRANPYTINTGTLEQELEDRADSEYKVRIEDVMEAVEDAREIDMPVEDRLGLRARIPGAGTDLLTGTSI